MKVRRVRKVVDAVFVAENVIIGTLIATLVGIFIFQDVDYEVMAFISIMLLPLYASLWIALRSGRIEDRKQTRLQRWMK